MVIQKTFGENGHCSICKLSDIDVVNYGEIHSNKELTVHLFCLYFSSNLPQKGKDTAGIVGFELHDIRKWILQCRDVICCYCNKGSATTSCHYPKCRRIFHQVCGFKANARFEYLDEFRSFCDKHNQIENETIEFSEEVGCFICYELFESYNPVTTVPSCGCGYWFHHTCLREYSLNAGYSFMCPTCRNKNYAETARRRGIYVPEYEALWEKTHDYADIERFYTHCDAAECVCPNPKGRTFSNHKWNMQLCSCCGSYGYHKLCRPVNERNDIIICGACKATVQTWESNDRDYTNSMLAELQFQQEEHAKKEQEEDAKKEQEKDARKQQEEYARKQQKENAKKEQEEDARKQQEEDAENEIVDLTIDDGVDDNVLDQRLTVSGVDVEQVASGNYVVDLADIWELNEPTNSRSDQRGDENLAEKRAREKAERPARDRMRNYRISLWFRDHDRFPQDPVE